MVESVRRALLLLESLNSFGTTSVHQLHEASKLPKSTIVRLLATLCEEGYVTKSRLQHGYQLTARVKSLSCGYEVGNVVVDAGQELAIEFTRAHRWPVAIATLDNPERVGLLEKIVVNAGGAVDVVFESADRMVLMKAVEAGVAPTIGPRVLVEGNPLLDLRTFTPSIGYPVAALVDPSRTRPAIDAVLATLRAGA